MLIFEIVGPLIPTILNWRCLLLTSIQKIGIRLIALECEYIKYSGVGVYLYNTWWGVHSEYVVVDVPTDHSGGVIQ